MRLRRFRGASVTAAMGEAKRELGPDALLLGTRHVEGGIEITAATDVDRVVAPSRFPAADTPPPALRSADPTRQSIHRLALQLGRVERRLTALGASVEPRRETQTGAPRAGEGAELSMALARHGVTIALAEEIAVRFEARRGQAASFDDAVAAAVADCLPTVDREGESTVQFFVGPTGSGKTTTIAKLAAASVAGPGRSPLLLNADTIRLGASEQLRALARVLDLEVGEVGGPAELRAALADAEPERPVYVDTAGLSSDEATACDILELIEDCGGSASVIGVVSATASRSSLERAWSQMGALQPESCVVTHMDESDEPGVVCSWLREVGVPLRWIGTGQRIPGELAEATGANLALWLVAA